MIVAPKEGIIRWTEIFYFMIGILQKSAKIFIDAGQRHC